MDNRKAALVTGAGRGIGRAIAIALAERGWSVGVNYNANTNAAEETLMLVEQAGARGVLLQANIAVAAERQAMLTSFLDEFERLDLLVNNAGMAPRVRSDLLETTESSYDEVMDVNLKGPFFLTQLAARTMIAQVQAHMVENPKIINIGSLSAYTASTNRGEYCISKAGLGMLTALFAARLAEYGIGVYEVRPGIIETDMTAKVKSRYDALFEQGLTPIQRWGQPEDVALAVAAIAEGALPYSTGEVINVDGGFHLRRL